MFFYLSKILGMLERPVIWLFILLVYLCFKVGKEHRRKLIFTTALFWLINSIPFMNLLTWAYEGEPKPFSALADSTYNYAIVLGGFTRADIPLTDRVFTGQGTDRFLHTLYLYKQGRVKKIIVTGGISSLMGINRTESAAMREIFELSGVKPEDILEDSTARNTYENAVGAKKLIDAEGINNPKVLLVTSAWHMPRSEKCFQAIQLPYTPLACDFRSHPPDLVEFFTNFTPNQAALLNLTMLVHEWLGIAAYKAAGYI